MAKKQPARKPKRTVMLCVETGDIHGLRELVTAGADVNDIGRREEMSALARAIELGSFDMVRALLDSGHRPNWGGIVHPLAHAVRERNLVMVDMLLDRGAAVDGEEEEGDTALMYAAGRGNLDVVKRLIKAGANVTHKNREGRDALDFASRGTSQEMIDLLRPHFPASRGDAICRQAHLLREKQQAVEKENRRRAEGSARAAAPAAGQPLTKAFTNGKHEELLNLLASGSYPNESNEEGTTLLAMVCSSWSGLDLVEPLLRAGADPNWQSKYVPLQMAAANGMDTVVRSLIEAGADVNARSKTGWTALLSAAGSGNIEVVQMILDAGADPNAEDEDGRTAYRQALDRNNPDIADLLRPLTRDREAAEKPWRSNKEGKSIERRLLAASEAGDAEFVRRIVGDGAPVDIADESFNTPLHLAAGNGHVEVVDALLDAGVPLEVPGCMDLTPLLAAVRAGEVDTVRRLVAAGANVAATDSEGRDALALAKYRNCDNVARFLSSLAH
jgi:cytohesin